MAVASRGGVVGAFGEGVRAAQQDLGPLDRVERGHGGCQHPAGVGHRPNGCSAAGLTSVMVSVPECGCQSPPSRSARGRDPSASPLTRDQDGLDRDSGGHVLVGAVDVLERVVGDQAAEGEPALSPRVMSRGRKSRGAASPSRMPMMVLPAASAEGASPRSRVAAPDEADGAGGAQRIDGRGDDMGNGRGVQGPVGATAGQGGDLADRSVGVAAHKIADTPTRLGVEQSPARPRQQRQWTLASTVRCSHECRCVVSGDP